MTADDFDAPPQGTARPVATEGAVLPVALLVSSARLILERQLGVVWVAGEVSNLFRAGSGHVYFTLKDASAQVKCTLWRNKAQLVPFTLRDGMAVEVRALPSMYEARGEFQLNVDAVRHAGVGALYERFLALKAKLEAAGWLAPGRKRPLPAFPRAVGVVTSPRGAALRDVLATIARRWPQPARRPLPLRGAGRRRGGRDRAGHPHRERPRRGRRAARVPRRRLDRGPVGVQRGGRRARRVRVGAARGVRGGPRDRFHDLRFRGRRARADADRRRRRSWPPTASRTGTAPAETARRLQRALWHVLATAGQRLDHASRRLVHPAARLAAQQALCVELARRLARAVAQQVERQDRLLAALRGRWSRELRTPLPGSTRLPVLRDALVRSAARAVERRDTRLAALAQNLAHLNPESVLARGYAIVVDRRRNPRRRTRCRSPRATRSRSRSRAARPTRPSRGESARVRDDTLQRGVSSLTLAY